MKLLNLSRPAPGRYWSGAYRLQKQGPGVGLHAGKSLLVFPWRILDNSGMPLSSPISDIFNALGKGADRGH